MLARQKKTRNWASIAVEMTSMSAATMCFISQTLCQTGTSSSNGATVPEAIELTGAWAIYKRSVSY